MLVTKRFALATSICAVLALPAVAIAKDKPAPVPPDWQSAAQTDNQQAFIDLNSIAPAGVHLSAVVRYEYVSPQPWKKDQSYSSVWTRLRVDCAQRRIADSETRAYAAAGLQGDVVRKATRKDKNLIWRDAARRTVDGEVLDHVCKIGPKAAPASSTLPGG
jgi:hypothetical protein